MLSRRQLLLQGSISLAFFLDKKAFAGAEIGESGTSESEISYSLPAPFSFDILAQKAKEKSITRYIEKINVNDAILSKLGYQELGEIDYKKEYALPGNYPVTFFHMGSFFKSPVKMMLLEENGGNLFSREILYKTQYFNIPEKSYAKQLNLSEIGFAGFRIHERKSDAHRPWQHHDWAAFLGASYFRAIGSLHQYGLSARALAIDSGIYGQKEDFPYFTEFYFEPQKDDSVTVYAFLEGRSVVGAYRFILSRGEDVEMDVQAKIFVRENTTRFGIAPLTSMYWYSETQKSQKDWRPEIHDSDGLSMITGVGQHIWRPLQNPLGVNISAFSDNNPQGFGLLQRDRNFENYLDGVHYEKRPHLWVEPLTEFGEGSVQLIEIPTQDETNDNIVVCWVPAKPVVKGDTLDLHYRLTWGHTEKSTSLAKCISTRTGLGGQPGQIRKEHLKKFVVEFKGDNIRHIVKPDISLSGGLFSTILWEKVPDAGGERIRIQFDFEPQQDITDIELYLSESGALLTETWVYQVHI